MFRRRTRHRRQAFGNLASAPDLIVMKPFAGSGVFFGRTISKTAGIDMAPWMLTRQHRGLLIFGALLSQLVPADAAPIEQAMLPPGCENVLAPLELKGAGIRKYSVLIFSTDVYAVYLYGPPDVSLVHLRQAQAESAAIIEILHEDLPDDMPDELRNMLEPALEPQEMARLSETYRWLEDSDRVTIDYEPGGGTRLAVNGWLIARAAGRELMDNLLETLIGPDAVSERLRQRLLAGGKSQELMTIRHAIVCDSTQSAGQNPSLPANSASEH